MYHKSIKAVEEDTKVILKRVAELTGIKESDTGLALPAHWDLAADKQTMQSKLLEEGTMRYNFLKYNYYDNLMLYVIT